MNGSVRLREVECSAPVLPLSLSSMSHPALARQRDKVAGWLGWPSSSSFPACRCHLFFFSPPPPLSSLHPSNTAGTALGIAGSKCARDLIFLLVFLDVAEDEMFFLTSSRFFFFLRLNELQKEKRIPQVLHLIESFASTYFFFFFYIPETLLPHSFRQC